MSNQSDQSERTILLRNAALRLGREKVSSMLPNPFLIWISDHDTGCQVWIDLKSEGRQELRA